MTGKDRRVVEIKNMKIKKQQINFSPPSPLSKRIRFKLLQEEKLKLWSSSSSIRFNSYPYVNVSFSDSFLLSVAELN